MCTLPISPIKQRAKISTSLVDAEIWLRIFSSVYPSVGYDICIGVTENVLQKHVRAMPEVEPPEVVVLLFSHSLLAVRRIVGECHLAKLIQTVNLMINLQDADIGFISQMETVVVEACHGFWLLSQLLNVLPRDWKQKEGLETLPLIFSFPRL